MKIDHSVYQKISLHAVLCQAVQQEGDVTFQLMKIKEKPAWVLAINRKASEKKGKTWIPVVCKRHFLPTDYKEKKMTTGLSHHGLEKLLHLLEGGKEMG